MLYRLPVDKDAPLALVRDEKFPSLLQLNDSLLSRNFPRGTLQFQIDIHRLILGGAAKRDLD